MVHVPRQRRDRSAPRPAPGPRRARPVALLVALIAGGAAAGLLGGQQLEVAEAGESVAVSSVLGSGAQGLEAELEATPQMAISEAEAQTRLQEVAASRAERAAKAATAAAEAEAAAEAARPDTVLPVEGARLTSRFAMRWGVMHWGIDLAAPMMTPEYSVEAGIVLRAGAASGYGQAIYIKHENGDVTVYGHMEKILVDAGDYVEAGQKIALLGSRGQSTGPHLHFEVHQGGLDGKRVDPVAWLRDRGVDI
ncbi:peptidoglycan DD-metalloendopeptidase family protein [Modestobacter sp. I12A-02628]|uniref:M23 family metallopeptidase n=1 Tax=Goekera deserti TaxID=2497753 RepID=A0A7K3WDH7_9ACTN|nr:M23 family metallopeptidase [Goekera deserti]MPQ98403.1 peptidoglycan DD-metalloendopeptidase family protein [Goekera deserti]NDI48230.1 peptidoglycan DD-metalloendopeptidase family protein [Goekera deserti]NEL53979.1 M23 family metallopeptidase [Goekera deserti]